MKKSLKTLNDFLWNNAQNAPTKGVVFIQSAKKEEKLAYSSLYEHAQRLLHTLQLKGLKPGDQVLFQFKDPKFFVQSFWACLLGGMVPVPLTPATNEEFSLKVLNVWKQLDSGYVLTDHSSMIANLKKIDSANSAMIMQSIESRTLLVNQSLILTGDPTQAQIHIPKPEDVAYIQFSSGSTGDPKGVVLTHENVVANVLAIMEGIQQTEDDIALSWLPLTHDLGLVGFHLVPMASRVNHFLMPTPLFVRRPLLWLDKASEHKVTWIASPNFGYHYVLDFLTKSENPDWDFSSVRLIFNGAEPIDINLCQQFLNSLKKWRLKPKTMLPVYGLAEACLVVTFPELYQELVPINLSGKLPEIGEKVTVLGSDDSNGQNQISLVHAGKTIRNCSLRICDENDQVLENGRIGLIQITGKSITNGYLNNPTANKKLFTNDGWLNTGDIGFLQNENLVITGRQKDVAFINGQAIFLHDVDRMAAEVEMVQYNKVAACRVFNQVRQREEIIVFLAFKGTLEEFIPVALELSEHFEKKMVTAVSKIIPVKRINRTTSGKVRRHRLVEEFEQGCYDATLQQLENLLISKESALLDCDPDKNDVSGNLQRICSKVLGIETIALDDNLTTIRDDSLLLLEITLLLDRIYPKKVSISDLFIYPTIRKLTEYIENSEIEILPKESTELVNDRIESLIGCLNSGEMDPDSIAANLSKL